MRSRLLQGLPWLVLLLVGALPGAPALAAAPAVPAPIGLDGGWQLHPDPGDIGLRAGWATGGAPASGWAQRTIPTVFDAVPRKAEFGGTVGWYRTTFTAPRATPGFDWMVHFEQVRRTARVWLNGHLIGTHADPYVSFALPLTGLRPGARNTLVVRVDNRKAPDDPREGWWNWGGIPRDVSLVPRGQLVLQDPGTMPEVRCQPGGTDCTAQVLVDGLLVNRGPTPVPAPRVRLQLGDGGAAADHTESVRALQPGEMTHVRFAVPVADPHLWSPEDPALYATTLTTSAGDAPQQVVTRRIGLRSVQVRDGALELNGRQLDLRGAAAPEDVPGHGPALTDGDIAGIVAELKAVHANVTRSQYLLNPKLLDALDAAGIMVWEQAPIYHRDRQLVTPAERTAALQTLRGTVLADRNHPSVLTHSVANELSVVPDRVPGTRAYLNEAVQAVRALDPTLPVSTDLLSYPGYPASATYRKFDLLGINSYFGWYPGKPRHSTASIAGLGPYLDSMRRMYPTQAMVLTEFGAESTFTGPARTKETYAFQSDYVRDVLQQVEKRPFLAGAIYWTLREFAVKPDWDGGAKRDVKRDSIHHKGLITYTGRRKPAWAVAEREFAATPLYRDLTAAQSLARPVGARGPLSGWPWLALVGVLALLAVDVWALAGILRTRARRPRTSLRA